ncbi:fibrinogen- and Ig-binding protein [Amia ocellicauda]|uniref:fibrinogen- and Ig-binding protein n=1 Tax=Amia ocellicauda TaxID=2972642 RepID=UPI003464282E
MTARHRKGKINHKQEDNSFKHDAFEPESRSGNHYTLLSILFLLILAGGGTVAWFLQQQHQTIASLADRVMGMQVKMVQLQTSQDEVQEAHEKLYSSKGYDQRISKLEEAHALAQQQVQKAVASFELLKEPDLIAKVSLLQTQMKTTTAELNNLLASQTKDLESIKEQVASITSTDSNLGRSLRSLSDSVAEYRGKVESLQESTAGQGEQLEKVREANARLLQSLQGVTSSASNVENHLDQHAKLLDALSSKVEEQTKDVLGLRESAATCKVQLDTNGQELSGVRELLQDVQAQRASQGEELRSIHNSLAEQSRDVQNINTALRTKLEAVQEQINKLQGAGQGGQPDASVLGELQRVTQGLEQLNVRVSTTVQSCVSGEVEASCEECSWPLEQAVQFPAHTAHPPVISLGLTQSSPGVRVRVAEPTQSGFKVVMDRAGEGGPSTIKVNWMACA